MVERRNVNISCFCLFRHFSRRKFHKAVRQAVQTDSEVSLASPFVVHSKPKSNPKVYNKISNSPDTSWYNVSARTALAVAFQAYIFGLPDLKNRFIMMGSIFKMTSVWSYLISKLGFISEIFKPLNPEFLSLRGKLPSFEFYEKPQLYSDYCNDRRRWFKSHNCQGWSKTDVCLTNDNLHSGKCRSLGIRLIPLGQLISLCANDYYITLLIDWWTCLRMINLFDVFLPFARISVFFWHSFVKNKWGVNSQITKKSLKKHCRHGSLGISSFSMILFLKE